MENCVSAEGVGSFFISEEIVFFYVHRKKKMSLNFCIKKKNEFEFRFQPNENNYITLEKK